MELKRPLRRFACPEAVENSTSELLVQCYPKNMSIIKAVLLFSYSSIKKSEIFGWFWHKKMHRTKEQLIISYIIMKWSKLFHHSLFRCTYACTFGQKQYFLVFFLSSCICGWADRAKERTKCGVRKYETVFELAPCCCWQKWSAGGRNVTKLYIPSTINDWVMFWHSNWGFVITPYNCGHITS